MLVLKGTAGKREAGRGNSTRDTIRGSEKAQHCPIFCGARVDLILATRGITSAVNVVNDFLYQTVCRSSESFF